MASTLFDGVVELKSRCSKHSNRNTRFLDVLSPRVDLIQDDVLKLVHCHNKGRFATLSNYLNKHPCD